eukprot:TRINITY_DN21351_c0_g1_i2.p2 TRINITY_DN21351_c0_g1~~TRINITY_DN21351_c0_g1_i2.p2  ORF type:complete len:247 (+),score=61.09 TRINITY_DN21351_c0_g1_i2:397-1137(+)
MMVAGNHEDHANFSNFNSRVRMPLYNEFQNHYYSFNFGNVHFLTINTHYYYKINDDAHREAMLRWVENDLIEATRDHNKRQRPWIIAMTHRPLYCSSLTHPDVQELHPLFQPFEDLFYKYNVDLFLAGHLHYYERMLPIYNYTLYSYQGRDNGGNNYMKNAKATVHIIDGISGNHENIKEIPTPKFFSAYLSNTIGYGELTLFNDTCILYEHKNSQTGDVIDYLYLAKDPDHAFGLELDVPQGFLQ